MHLRHCCILTLLWSSIRAMECLLGCFRVKDNNNQHRSQPPHRLVSNSIQSNSTKGVPVLKKQLSSLLLAEEEGEALVVKDRENLVRRSGCSEFENDGRELKDEAKFLKACGVLPETPAEIRKISKKFKDSPLHDANSQPPKFHSWLPNTSMGELLDAEKQCDQSPDWTKFQVEQENHLGLEQDSSLSSCVVNEESEISVSISYLESLGVSDSETRVIGQVDGTSETGVISPSAASCVGRSQRRNKSVRFESQPFPSDSSPQITGKDVERSDFARDQSVQKPTPCPTPLKLTDEMQTPGTVFATNLGNLASRNNAKIRSQYVYTVQDPADDNPCRSLLKQDGIIMPLGTAEAEAHGQTGKHTPSSVIQGGVISANKDLKGELSLSAWLKPPSSSHGIAGRNHGDRPIIGIVAAHWKEEEEVPRISPKGGCANGIPNSTTKYKEDQKVSWHATPFEERLEKALSEEGGIICQRRAMSGAPIVFDEHDSDVAEPQFQSLSCPKSVISF
ncbi:hypothetical protein Dimus_019516 [Dionaea muscipula]